MGVAMTLIRQFIGEVLRARRAAAGLTLRDVSSRAQVSLGYISEVERGQKEASSELLSSLAVALDVPLSKLLSDVSDMLKVYESDSLVHLPDIDVGDKVSLPAA